MSASELLTVHEVAERLRVGTRTIWRWAKSGSMPAPVRFGPSRRVVRWKAADIDYFVQHVLGTMPARDPDDEDLRPPHQLP